MPDYGPSLPPCNGLLLFVLSLIPCYGVFPPVLLLLHPLLSIGKLFLSCNATTLSSLRILLASFIIITFGYVCAKILPILARLSALCCVLSSSLFFSFYSMNFSFVRGFFSRFCPSSLYSTLFF